MYHFLQCHFLALKQAEFAIICQAGNVHGVLNVGKRIFVFLFIDVLQSYSAHRYPLGFLCPLFSSLAGPLHPLK